MPALRDLTGKVFGRLTVLRRAENTREGRAQWLCRCSCSNGTETIIRGGDLERMLTRSCGCLRRETTAKRNVVVKVKHGCKRTPEYRSWRAMTQRCLYTKSIGWKDYGGRRLT